ncbi:MAG: TIGR04282 family arsenosugar biosynthesis glycosyltransferase [Mangrovicoccus sp.]|nr:TIGR04282 family arsenosugar biosynthesis glycosyltransferase [Mangrovicoccus sp.]
MVKEPHPGRVKTRLGREIGYVPAAWWFRHQSRAVLKRLRDPRWDLQLAVSPDREGMLSRIWPRDLRRIPQGQGDLGARMGRLLRAGGTGAGPVIVIGADIPGITKPHIAHAFHLLQSHDAVLGPAEDGGYWLIGAARRRALPPALFQDVRWSSPYALADTEHSLRGQNIARAATLWDVDRAADLIRLRQKPPRPGPQSPPAQ